MAAATVLISMGAVLGRTTYLQLVVMGILETIVYTGNSYVGYNIFKVCVFTVDYIYDLLLYDYIFILYVHMYILFKVTDVGGSIFIHTFGAYFGLGVSCVLTKRMEGQLLDKSLEQSSYTSDLFAMIGMYCRSVLY